MNELKDYTNAGFWQKLNTFARKRAGHNFVEKSRQRYYAAESPETPTWARGVILGALGGSCSLKNEAPQA